MDCSFTLIERLADRLCHDFASSAQAVASGLDLLREAGGQAEREEAEAFLAEAIAAQKAKIAFARRAYGPAHTAVAAAELEGLISATYSDIRPEVDWRIASSALEPTEARGLLVLANLGCDILALGGMARLSERLESGRRIIELDAEGPRPTLRDEVRSGLKGVTNEAGLGGRWAQAAFIRSLAHSAGGEVGLEESAKGVRIWLSLPTSV